MSGGETIIMFLMIAGVGIIFRAVVSVVSKNPGTAARAGFELWKHFNK